MEKNALFAPGILNPLKQAPAALQNNVADPWVQAGDFIACGNRRKMISATPQDAAANTFRRAEHYCKKSGEAPRARFRHGGERLKRRVRRFNIS